MVTKVDCSRISGIRLNYTLYNNLELSKYSCTCQCIQLDEFSRSYHFHPFPILIPTSFLACSVFFFLGFALLFFFFFFLSLFFFYISVWLRRSNFFFFSFLFFFAGNKFRRNNWIQSCCIPFSASTRLVVSRFQAVFFFFFTHSSVLSPRRYPSKRYWKDGFSLSRPL